MPKLEKLVDKPGYLEYFECSSLDADSSGFLGAVGRGVNDPHPQPLRE
jgi:hypothetical protein